MSEDQAPVNLYAAIDWASESHYRVIQSPAGDTLAEGYFPNSAEGFERLLAELDSLRGGGPAALIFEATRGAVHYALLGVDWLRLCPVNPVKTRKLNELDGSSRGKSDPRDAQLLCGYLRGRAAELLARRPEDDSLTLRLREALALEACLVERVTKLKQRIHKDINNLCPQLSGLLDDLERRVHRDCLLELSPADLPSRGRVEEFLAAHSVRDPARIAAFADAYLALRCLGRDRQLQREQLENLRSSVRLLGCAVDELRRCEGRVDALFGRMPQAAIYRSMPDVGPRLGPRLAGLFGSRPAQSFASKEQALAYFGQSPVTRQTGARDNKSVRTRRCCHRQARHVAYLWARVANLSPRPGWQKAYLAEMKARGDGVPTRYRKLGKKLVSILYRCLADDVPYDPEKYMGNLRKKA